MADTFIGELKSILQYQSPLGETKYIEVGDIFVEVMMSAHKTKNMYEAWENLYQNQIEGYQTPEGDTATATKVDWITKLPSVFSLQINRLTYVNNNAEKFLTPLNIEPVIYADRFLLKNREQVEKIRL